MKTPLGRLARLYGVQTSYIGLGKKRKDASPEALLSVLAALGAPVRKMDDVPKALETKEKELKFGVQPVVVAWDGRLDRKTARKFGKLPKDLPAGYYTSNETLIISAPTRAYFPFVEPTWGVFAPVYALHSKRSKGIGDLSDFSSIVNWMASLGGNVTATLPLLANFMEEPFEPSPYSPASRIFWNELYADPERTAEFNDSVEARKSLAAPCPDSELVDYRAVMTHRRAVIEALSKTFFAQHDGGRHEAFETFLRSNPQLDDYARFRAVTDRRRAGWNQWPERMRGGDIQPSDYDEEAWRYHMYAQWIVQEQLQRLSDQTKGAGGTLYLDLPLGLHVDSYDTWRFPDFFVKGMSGGAPPDIVFTTGQNWSLPPMNPQKMRENRYAYTIAYIRNHLKYASLLRIDHVMGLHRFFWIPEGMPTSEGVYVEYPAEELYAILSVESHRNKAGIVGENLGNVAPIVNTSMRRHNIQQMYVAQYQLSDSENRNALGRVPANAVASLNTHDMPPYRAFLDGSDIPDKLVLGFVDKQEAIEEENQRARLKKSLVAFLRKRRLLSRPRPEEILRASLLFLGRSKAKVVLVNLEDLWQEVLPQNIPATSRERPNWRRRLRYSVERILEDPEIERILRGLNNVRCK